MSRAAPALLRSTSNIRLGACSSSRAALQARPSPCLERQAFRTIRFNSTLSSSGASSSKRRMRISPVFWIAIGGLVLYPTYMIVEYVASARAWPPAVRKHLREALRAKQVGRTEEADVSFQKAIQAALALPPSAFAPNPLLMVAGLYAEYASMLETTDNPIMAYEQLVLALNLFGSAPLDADPHRRISSAWAGGQELTLDEHLRAVALNQKLGQLALQLANSPRVHPFPKSIFTDGDGPMTFLDAAEVHLSSALTALLRIGLPANVNESKEPDQAVVVGRDVELPISATGAIADRQSLGVTMEALAEVYAKKGQIEYAQQLLMQAISTLIPPDQATPHPRDRCQAAMLMTSISGYSSQSTSQVARKISRSWALKALEMSNAAVDDAKDTNDQDVVKQICGRAATVALFNLGMLAEIDKDTPKALDRFSKSLARAREISFKQGEMQSAESIKRIRYAGNKWTGS